MADALLFSNRHRSIQDRFEEFHAKHPDVFALFKRFAGELRGAGHRQYSADAILHRIRWHYAINADRDEGRKINDHFSSRYGRKLMEEDSSYDGFFETRELHRE